MKKVFNTTVSIKETASGGVLRGIVQYDTLVEVNIRLSDGFKAFDYTGYTNIIFKVLKPDGTTVIDSEGIRVIATSPSDGIVTVLLAGQTTAVDGLCQCIIEIYSSGEKMATARLNYEVFEALEVTEGDVESSDEYPVLQNLVADLSSMESAIEIAEGLRMLNESSRVSAELARESKEIGYVAQAKEWAEAAEKYAKMTADTVEGDFATRAELEEVAGGVASVNGVNPDENGKLHLSASDIGAAAEKHAAKHAKGGVDAITPASIGAFPAAGGVVAGPILLKTTSKGYAQFLKNHSETDDYGSYVEDVDADGNVTRVTLRSAAASPDVAFRFEHKGTSYKIYGEHNKPSPADIGAAEIEEGYYVGTDSLTFDLTFGFVPRVVFITSTTAASQSMGIWVHGSPSLYHILAERNSYSTLGFPVAFDEENKKLTVTSNFVSNGVKQPYLNWSGHRFNYVAIR